MKGMGRRELGGEPLKRLSIRRQLMKGMRRASWKMERRDNDVTNGNLALASLLELRPIRDASDCQRG
jgi:hypothetical protein